MTIGEVSREYGLTADTLRYYEKIGLIPAVLRNKSGNRDYGQEDCKWIEFIKCMRGAGLSIEVLTEYVALFQEGDKTLPRRKELLAQQREQLVDKMEEMKRTIDRLDCKIENYDRMTLGQERGKEHENQTA